MFRLRPTHIVPSDDEIYSSVQRILVARILERGGDLHVSPHRQRQSSSEAAPMDSPLLALDSSSFEEFTDCGPDDCDSSPSLSSGKGKRKTSSEETQTEHHQLSPGHQEAPPSGTDDTRLAEQLETITLSFTSFLSPSIWLGPFASSSGPVGGNLCQERGDDFSTTPFYPMKPMASFLIPPGFPPLKCHALYSDIFLCSEESNKAFPVLGCAITGPIPPRSARCSSPYFQSIASTPSLSHSQDTDLESESQDGFTSSNPGSSRELTTSLYGIDPFFNHFGQSPATSDANCGSDNSRTVKKVSNVNCFQCQWHCPKGVPDNSYASAITSLSCYGFDSIAPEEVASSQASQSGSSSPDQSPATPASSVEGVSTVSTSRNPTQGYPIASSSIVTRTGRILLIAPKAIADQIPQIERISQEAIGLPQVPQSYTFFTLPWLTLQPMTPTYPVLTPANQPQPAIPLRHTGINYYHVPLGGIVRNPIPPSPALNQEQQQQYTEPTTNSAYPTGHGYLVQQAGQQVHDNNASEPVTSRLPAGSFQMPLGVRWRIQQFNWAPDPTSHPGGGPNNM
ncbi:hypothetical protein, variant [Blastomyces gilchristii SLH14081]|uniref:Uncharacterized protein n=1 Tax=Blastomyces gilchristii (strain SLH14081) TaxID=559298 RepID=A0A179UFH5_BLAGS|nr:hypothetical protein, variant [Blastomyces gilchristii SLH14081]OAT06785.1 hypothetical protein, variant [Blastomyces gilchristii SLH14081]